MKTQRALFMVFPDRVDHHFNATIELVIGLHLLGFEIYGNTEFLTWFQQVEALDGINTFPETYEHDFDFILVDTSYRDEVLPQIIRVRSTGNAEKAVFVVDFTILERFPKLAPFLVFLCGPDGNEWCLFNMDPMAIWFYGAVPTFGITQFLLQFVQIGLCAHPMKEEEKGKYYESVDNCFKTWREFVNFKQVELA
jgi:hypothetical protein